MNSRLAIASEDRGLAEAVEQRIRAQTGNRVHGLRVELRGGRLTILGHVAAYRIKQLAIRALLEVVSIRSPLDIRIRVCEAIDANLDCAPSLR